MTTSLDAQTTLQPLIPENLADVGKQPQTVASGIDGRTVASRQILGTPIPTADFLGRLFRNWPVVGDRSIDR